MFNIYRQMYVTKSLMQLSASCAIVAFDVKLIGIGQVRF